MSIIDLIRDRLSRKEYEPERTEPVAHDIVIIDGKELTSDDFEEGQRL